MTTMLAGAHDGKKGVGARNDHHSLLMLAYYNVHLRVCVHVTRYRVYLHIYNNVYSTEQRRATIFSQITHVLVSTKIR